MPPAGSVVETLEVVVAGLLGAAVIAGCVFSPSWHLAAAGLGALDLGFVLGAWWGTRR